MSLANCNLDTLSKAAKCFDCLPLTVKMALKVRFMGIALKAVGGPDLTNINTLKQTVACLGCEPDFRLDSMEVAIWKNLAENFGATVPSDIASIRALVKCVPCGEQKFQRAAFVYLLCQLSTAGLQQGGIVCWVSREVYGANDPRWLIFRSWLMGPAPGWLRGIYVGYGQRFAKWIADKPKIKAIVRKLMDRVVNRSVSPGG